jgi:hypothetical protein
VSDGLRCTRRLWHAIGSQARAFVYWFKRQRDFVLTSHYEGDMKRISLILTMALLAASCSSNGIKAMETDENFQDIEALFATNATLQSVCQRQDVEGFKYFLFHEARARKLFIGPLVQVTPPGKGMQRLFRKDYVMPSFGIDRGREMVTGGPEDGAWLKVDIKPLTDGAFQLEWVRAKYELTGAAAMPGRLERTYGPIGKLTFVRTTQCWALSDDVVEDAPEAVN